MKKQQPMRQSVSNICEHIREDDGLDPRKFFNRTFVRKNSRKGLQLCAQTAETLNIIFGGELQDDELFGLTVQEVIPKDQNSLTIKVIIPNGTDVTRANLILRQLRKLSGRLRREVAAAICRKRVPELSFQLVQPEEEKI